MANNIDYWLDISYLREGNEKQKLCFEVLTELNIMNILKPFDPIIAGTIPINIDIDNSDIDIICHSIRPYMISTIVDKHFISAKNFEQKTEGDIYFATFSHKSITIEIYSTSIPSIQQKAFRHMMIEYRLLQIFGDHFREKIVQLKESGYKTEPAFGILLNLPNPYEDLLELESLSDNEIRTKLNI